MGAIDNAVTDEKEDLRLAFRMSKPSFVLFEKTSQEEHEKQRREDHNEHTRRTEVDDVASMLWLM